MIGTRYLVSLVLRRVMLASKRAVGGKSGEALLGLIDTNSRIGQLTEAVRRKPYGM